MKRTDFSPRTALTRREAIRRAAGAGALASLSSLAGFGVTNAEAAEEAVGKFPKHPQWKFVFVNHVTTNPFFVPTRYGAGRLRAVGVYLPVDRIREIDRYRHG